MFISSTDFASGSWNTSGLVAASATGLAPDGSASTYKITETAVGNNLHQIFQTKSLISGTTYTLSSYMKASERTWGALSIDNGGSSAVSFDLNTCSVGSTPAGFSANSYPVGNGWCFCSVTRTITTTGSWYPDILIAQSNGTTAYTQTVGSGIFIWGSQFEQNLSPSSYLATTSAARFDSPRFDYDPVTLTPKGILAEGARTNLLTGQFTNAGNNLTLTANAATGPDGTTTASLYSCNVNGSANDCWVQRQEAVVSSTTTYTFSVFLKQGSGPTTLLNLMFNGGTFLQSTATVTWGATPTVSISGTGAAGSIAASTNGWYRVSLTQPNNGSGNNTLYIRVYTRDQGSANVIGDAAYIWGAQVEAGTSSTTYIPTTTSAVSRAGEGITFQNVSWFSNTAGSVEIEALTSRYQSDGSFANTYMGIFGIINAGLTEGLRVAFSGFSGGTSPVPRVMPTASGSSQNLFPTPPSAGTYSKFGMAFAASDFATTVNNTTAATSSSGAMIGTVTSASLGTDAWSGGNPLNGWVKKFNYFNSRTPNVDLLRRSQ